VNQLDDSHSSLGTRRRQISINSETENAINSAVLQIIRDDDVHVHNRFDVRVSVAREVSVDVLQHSAAVQALEFCLNVSTGLDISIVA